MGTEVLLIAGDFNFYVGCPSDPDVKAFANLLDTFGLIQHVQVPTHSSGHTLDLIITRSVNDIMITSPLTTCNLSALSFVECLLDIPRPNISVSEGQFCKLKQIDLEKIKADKFTSDLCNAIWLRIDEMAKCCDDTLRSILDNHAPLRSKVMAVRPTVSWFDDNLKKLKAKRRKLERKMIKSGLRCDKDAYRRKVCDAYSALLSKTRKTY